MEGRLRLCELVLPEAGVGEARHVLVLELVVSALGLAQPHADLAGVSALHRIQLIKSRVHIIQIQQGPHWRWSGLMIPFRNSESSSKKFSSSPWMLLSCSSIRKSSLRSSPRMIQLSVCISSSSLRSSLPSITIDTVRWITLPLLVIRSCELDMLRAFLASSTGLEREWGRGSESLGEEDSLVWLRRWPFSVRQVSVESIRWAFRNSPELPCLFLRGERDPPRLASISVSRISIWGRFPWSLPALALTRYTFSLCLLGLKLSMGLILNLFSIIQGEIFIYYRQFKLKGVFAATSHRFTCPLTHQHSSRTPAPCAHEASADGAGKGDCRQKLKVHF